jgi:hypothetical protein
LCNTTPENLILNKKDDIDTIEFLCEEFYECLYYTLDTIITESDYRPKNWKWFWNKQLQAQANLRQACYTRWRKTVGFEKGLWWGKYKQAGLELKLKVKQARAKAYRKFCDNLDEDPQAAMPIVKRIINSKTKSVNKFTSIEGPQHAVDTMAQFWKNIYDGNNLPLPENQLHTCYTNPSLPPNTTNQFLDTPYDFHDCPFNEIQVINAIKRLPNKKSPCIDHITAEMIKPITLTIARILHHFFRISWITGHTPLTWRQSQVVPIYKSGDQLDAANYRPISLTSTFRKILEYCLQKTLYDQTNFIDKAQGGFKPFLNSVDQAACLDEFVII